ncbi:hypothetical protein HanHA300_Chr04g0141741 [Helianthus annuus]|nr:hypothetical protein HanHA300_Chr04g0141741 [Helianthus annuus]KAJ0589463.1 hypothetical protein HanIR_Chr04g0186541 [Helianthus annuus]KAJ0758105.1 hypothetical protein HanLR1_Chr04g0146561 [Helianthus annuus]KAJ0761772.1 hypothetical protein HanOQP8_Chr04g0153811 [Helianthus annuus]
MAAHGSRRGTTRFLSSVDYFTPTYRTVHKESGEKARPKVMTRLRLTPTRNLGFDFGGDKFGEDDIGFFAFGCPEFVRGNVGVSPAQKRDQEAVGLASGVSCMPGFQGAVWKAFAARRVWHVVGRW